MKTIKAELPGLRASINRILASSYLEEIGRGPLEAILGINDNLDLLEERAWGGVVA